MAEIVLFCVVAAGVVVLAVQLVVLLRLRETLQVARRRTTRQGERLKATSTQVSRLATEVSALPHAVAEERVRTVREIEAVIDLRAAVPTRTTMPSTQGWAASPMTTSTLVRQVLDHAPALVVEAGSGGSSVWVGYCLERIGRGRCISLDHEEEYAEKTRAELRRHGLDHLVEVRVCPLVEHEVGGETFRWYDMSGLDDVTGIDLLFVDGPPGRTGRQARYPAVPLLHDKLSPAARILLDDSDRTNERKIIERWVAENDVTVLDSEQVGTGWTLCQVP